MSGIIQYTATIFQEPKPIAENLYQNLKPILHSNPYYNIVENESFTSKFSRYITMIIIGVIGVALSYTLKLIFGNAVETLFDWISIPSGIILFGGFIYLFLEGFSYSSYLQKSDAYFLRMKYAILKSNSFFEFNEIFYSIFSSDYDSDFKKWKKQYYKLLNKQIKENKSHRSNSV